MGNILLKKQVCTCNIKKFIDVVLYVLSYEAKMSYQYTYRC